MKIFSNFGVNFTHNSQTNNKYSKKYQNLQGLKKDTVNFTSQKNPNVQNKGGFNPDILSSISTENIEEIQAILDEDVTLKTDEEAKQYVLKEFSSNLEGMRESFQQQKDQNGIISNFFDNVKKFTGFSVSSNDIEQTIKKQEEFVNALYLSLEGNGEETFEEIYQNHLGVEFDKDKINEYRNNAKIYQAVLTASEKDPNYYEKFQENKVDISKIAKNYLQSEKTAFGQDGLISDIVAKYSQSQEEYSDKLSSAISFTGMGLIVAGAGISILCPAAAPVAMTMMSAGRHLSTVGMFIDNAIDLIDDATDNNGLEKEELKENVHETVLEGISLFIGRKIGNFTNGLNNLVQNNLLSKGVNKIASYIVGQSAETAADTALSLGADYVVAQTDSKITTGNFLNNEDYWSLDRFLGEGKNQLIGILTGVASVKIDNYQKGIISSAQMKLLEGDEKGARETLEHGGIKTSDASFENFKQSVEEAKVNMPEAQKDNTPAKIQEESEIEPKVEETTEPQNKTGKEISGEIQDEPELEPEVENTIENSIENSSETEFDEAKILKQMQTLDNMLDNYLMEDTNDSAPMPQVTAKTEFDEAKITELQKQNNWSDESRQIFSGIRQDVQEKIKDFSDEQIKQFMAAFVQYVDTDFALAAVKNNWSKESKDLYVSLTSSFLPDSISPLLDFSDEQMTLLSKRGDILAFDSALASVKNNWSDENAQFYSSADLDLNFHLKDKVKHFSNEQMSLMAQKTVELQDVNTSALSIINGWSDDNTKTYALLGDFYKQQVENFDNDKMETLSKRIKLFKGDQTASMASIEEGWSDRAAQLYIGLNEEMQNSAVNRTAEEMEKITDTSKRLNIDPNSAMVSFIYDFSDDKAHLVDERLKLLDGDINAASISVLRDWSMDSAKFYASLDNTYQMQVQFFTNEEMEKFNDMSDRLNIDKNVIISSIALDWSEENAVLCAQRLIFFDGDIGKSMKSVENGWSYENARIYSTLDESIKFFMTNFSAEQINLFAQRKAFLNDDMLALISVAHEWSDEDTKQCADVKEPELIYVLTKEKISKFVEYKKYVDENSAATAAIQDWSLDSAKFYCAVKDNRIRMNLHEEEITQARNKMALLGVDEYSAASSVMNFWSDENTKLYNTLDKDARELLVNKSNEDLDTVRDLMENSNADSMSAAIAVHYNWSLDNTKIYLELDDNNKIIAQDLTDWEFSKAIQTAKETGENISTALYAEQHNFSIENAKFYMSISDESAIKEVNLYRPWKNISPNELLDKAREKMSQYNISAESALACAYHDWSEENAKMFDKLSTDEKNLVCEYREFELAILFWLMKIHNINIETAIAVSEGDYNDKQIETIKKYIDKGIGAQSATRLVEHNIDLTKTLDIAPISSENQKELFTRFFSNRDKSVDNTIKSADFAKYGKSGLPLEYSRSEFLADLTSALKDVDIDMKNNIFNKIGITPIIDKNGAITGYDGFINTKNLSSEGTEGEILALLNHFTKNNKIITKDEKLDTSLNALIKGIPEFIDIIGKQQHSGHAYSLDIHILEAYKNVLSNPEFQKLSAFDKTRLKMMTILHDIGKPENVKDKDHALTSSDYSNSILARYNPTSDEAVRYNIMNLILNHHWSESVEKANKNIYSLNTAASQIENKQDMILEDIFAHADVEAIGHEVGFKTDGSKVMAAINKMNETKPLAYNTPVVFKDKFPTADYNGKKIGSLNLKDLDPETDMGEFGFIAGTKAKDILLAIHAANSQSQFKTFDLLQNPESGSPQSISFVSQENNPAFKRFGIVLDVQAKDVINATHYDQGCGTAKSADDITELATSDHYRQKGWREEIPDIIKEKLNLDSRAYSDLTGQVEKYRYLSQIKDNQEFMVTNSDGEVISLKGKEIKDTISQANHILTSRAAVEQNGITEYVVKNAKNTGIYYVRYDSLEDAQIYPELKAFLDELPEGAQVIFGGYVGNTYSHKSNIWNKTIIRPKENAENEKDL